jgi:transcriptional regulator with XRE-family HTH domain
MDKTREQAVKDTVGRIINKARKSKNWSKTDMGKVCGLGYNAITNWEAGLNLPPAGFMVELAEILVNGTPNDLYGIKTSELTFSQILDTEIDLNKLIMLSDKLTFDNIPLPMDIRGNLIQAVSLVLDTVGLSKKNIYSRQ